MNPTRWLRPRTAALLLALACGVATARAAAHPTTDPGKFDFEHPTFVHALPFAKEKVVIQISGDRPAKWNLALNNAQNLLNFFGPQNVRVVVVAFGPGLRMLLHDSPLAARIDSQNREGVEFDACHNTMETMARKTGRLPQLVASAVVVPAGVVRILQLEHQGFGYIRP